MERQCGPAGGPVSTTLDIVEAYFGADLTPDLSERIRNLPGEHVVPLVERLAAYYDTWLDDQIAQGDKDSSLADISCRIDPFVEPWDLQETLTLYKKFLLYFPRFVIADPLADLFYVPITLSFVLSGLVPTLQWDEAAQRRFADAIQLLAELA